jgi:hypothetical protein
MRLRFRVTRSAAVPWLAASLAVPSLCAQTLPSPAQVFGHEIGADRKLVDWDGIVRYMQMADQASDRVNLREVGKSSHGRPFLLLEISSPQTLADLDRYKALQRRLYFQDHVPGQDPDAVHTPAQREELFSQHKAVVLITCTIHATEVGAAQMTLELVHALATGRDERTRKILDNVIFLLVPSLNPDGQDMVVEWYNRYVGSEYEAGNIPWLYHPYVGHDNNRDLYMLTQAESRHISQILYKDWFPSIWLDEHQMGSTGPRIFTMPATDPINLNVHPLIYRLNGIYGQAQAAALEAAGKTGIIYDFTYTNFWPGAMAWTGWWHNQVGMLTEVASVRIATPTYQRMARMGETPAGGGGGFGGFDAARATDTLPPPRDTQPRTNYPRPWLGGEWRLRDIVDYELIATMALLESAADTRRTLLEQLYDVNRVMIREFAGGARRTAAGDRGRIGAIGGDRGGGGNGGDQPALAGDGGRTPAMSPTGRVMELSGPANGTPYAVVVDPDQRNPIDAAKMLQLLEANGVIVERATQPFEAAGRRHNAGTWVIRLGQVFGAYAKEMLETQVYPEVRPSPESPPRPPYDVTAWTLGLLMDVETRFVGAPFNASLEVVRGVALPRGRITGSGGTFLIDGSHNTGYAAANRLWAAGGARIRRAGTGFTAANTRFGAGTWIIEGVPSQRMRDVAELLGLPVFAVGPVPAAASATPAAASAPRVGLYQPWGSNMDEGWTRWVLEQFGFEYTTLHPQDLRAAAPNASGDHEIPADERAEWPGHVKDRAPPRVVKQPLAGRFDVLVFADQNAESILRGTDSPSTPPLYRGGIGDDGLAALQAFVQSGGTAVALGAAGDLFIGRWPIPVKNVARTLNDNELLIPGSIVRLEADPQHALTWGMPERTHGFFIRSPFYTLTDALPSQQVSVPLRYPNTNVRASGWIRGEEQLQGRAAAVQVDFDGGGRIVLIGIRPQHRAQTHATFKVLFNALVNAGRRTGA